MAGERGKLTDLQIRHWVKAGVPSAKADGGGLTFTLSAGGSAGWILRYSFGGRRRELTIGRYPDIGLAEARGIATLKRAEVQQGRNPAAEKQKAKATAARDWTVRDLAKDYRTKKLVSLAHSTQVSYGRHLKRVEKKLGALSVREIEASDVVALIEGAGLTWGESNMLLITTKWLPPRKVVTARRFVKAIASQHASGAMWRLPKQTRPSRGPRQPRGLDPRCGARAAPRTRPPRRPDWQRPFRDGRAGRSRGPCRRPAAIAGGTAGLACKQRPVRERVGEELERRLRRAGVLRSPERVRELGTVTAAASGAGQASVVRPPVGAGPLGATAARCASPRAGVGHGLEGGARVGPWRGAMASMTTRRREGVGFCARPPWRAQW